MIVVAIVVQVAMVKERMRMRDLIIMIERK
jgi:hypothetical protein